MCFLESSLEWSSLHHVAACNRWQITACRWSWRRRERLPRKPVRRPRPGPRPRPRPDLHSSWRLTLRCAGSSYFRSHDVVGWAAIESHSFRASSYSALLVGSPHPKLNDIFQAYPIFSSSSVQQQCTPTKICIYLLSQSVSVTSWPYIRLRDVVGGAVRDMASVYLYAVISLPCIRLIDVVGGAVRDMASV